MMQPVRTSVIPAKAGIYTNNIYGFRVKHGMTKEKGFTLVELLVVVTVTAVLSAIGLVAYGAVIKNGRDAKRQTDLLSVQSALEQYFADNLFYPSAISFGSAFSSGGKTYLSKVPTDPTNSAPYVYCYKALKTGSTCDDIMVPSTNCDNATVDKCVTYCLYAKLENPPTGVNNYTCGNGTTFTLKVLPP